MPRMLTAPGALLLAANAFAEPAAGPADAHAPGMATLSGHVPSALQQATIVPGTVTPDTPLTLTIVLRRDDPEGFAGYLADVYDPNSARYRRFLRQDEITARFGPSREAYDQLASYLVAKGYRVSGASKNRLTLSVTGPRSLSEDAFGVAIRGHRIGQRRFYANREDPHLPVGLAEHVQAIIGLSDLPRPAPARQAIASFLYQLCKIANPKRKTDQEQQNWYSLCTSWVKDRYGVNGPAPNDPPGWDELTGAGQRVGIIAFDRFEQSDIIDYLALMGRPAALADRISEVPIDGGAALGPNEAEVLLDIITVLSIAPGADVAVYHGPFTGGQTSFQRLFNAAIDDGQTIITNSFAYCEDQTTLADVQSLDAIFQTAAASGITVVNASGDTGSTCLNGAPNTIAVPAGAPSATAVGGTSHRTGPGYVYGDEVWWNGIADAPPTGQGGFGTSRFFAAPSYQQGLSGETMRSIPDLVANADPALGVVICQASDGGCPNGRLYGGTSASAPQWAGYVALVNEALGTDIGDLNQALYPLAGTTAFHDAAALGSDFAHVGLGSPNLNQLYLHLSGQSIGTPSAAISEVYSFIEGPVPWGQLDFFADGATIGYINVRLLDDNGNPVPGKTIELTPSPGGNVQIDPPTAVTTIDNGVATFTVTTLVPETVTFTATDLTDGIVLDNQTEIQFVTPPAASGGIQASPTSVSNNGIATTTITVTLEDVLGRPTPGKLISLSQGDGRSVVSGPDPAVTDANGRVAFTATNLANETVTYTAINVTDGNLPIPGAAQVAFFGGPDPACLGFVPDPAPGFELTPFATGFETRSLFFEGINFGCVGASNPTFDSNGPVFVANAGSGDLFRLPADGGAASSSDLLSNLGLTLGQPVFGKDGKLYAVRSATAGQGNRSGAIIEVDPQTGAELRVVADGLTCPSGLSVDPLSGDLFFDNICFGAGLDDATLFRVDPSAAQPVVEEYAELPGAPNGGISIAPDGTIYVVTEYDVPPSVVVAVSGTDAPGDPVVTPVPNVFSTFWVTVGAANPDGSAKSLIVLDLDGQGTDGLKLVELGSDPLETTDLTIGGISSGMIGPDGCIYSSNNQTIFRLAPTAGECEFAATNPSPMLSLTPTQMTEVQQGQVQPLVAELRNVSDPEGLPVLFSITGTNPQLHLVRADADGRAQLDLLGVFTGDDSIAASTEIDDSELTSNTSRLRWVAGRSVTGIGLNLSPTTATLDQPTDLNAVLTDLSSQPPGPISGASVMLDLGGETCVAVTDADGLATCSATPRFDGFTTLSAAFAGTAALAPSADSIGVTVLLPSSSVNIINGTPERDTLVGTDGDDRITGFQQRDSITTGDGADWIVYTSTADFGDRIADFAAGSDVIDLSAFQISSADPIADGLLLFRERRGDTTILLDVDGPGGARPKTMATMAGVPLAEAAQLGNFVGFGP